MSQVVTYRRTCRVCRRAFTASRKDHVTCSDKCRTARSRARRATTNVESDLPSRDDYIAVSIDGSRRERLTLLGRSVSARHNDSAVSALIAALVDELQEADTQLSKRGIVE